MLHKNRSHQVREIRLVLGDQLNINHSWFNKKEPAVLYVMMEIKPEASYVLHHIQKIVGVFSAMRSFSTYLEENGHEVKYFKISDADNKQSFKLNIKRLLEKYPISSIQYQEPDEYRLNQLLHNDLNELGIDISMVSSEHFYTERYELKSFFQDRKQVIMEDFYRHMRRKHNVLMSDEGKPVTGKWNYDKENRKKFPSGFQLPEPKTFNHNVNDVYQEIQEAGINSFGEIDTNNYLWPLNRSEALVLFNYFTDSLLPFFGTYQDAMTNNGWSLFHSRISFALNLKMISPREVVDRVEVEWRNNADLVSISQAEGFIRQILGWREYMRGIYWFKMPVYAQLNYFESGRKMPEFFWTGKTKMNCVAKSVGQSLQYAYAHHIQRLMVTGNFAALAGIDPDEVDNWYLGIYIDAFDWVEITNTRGMSQFADGGIVGTKPYVSSAAYIHKMSDYCKSCPYDHKKKTGENACPFNSLYWHFIDRNMKKLDSNPRMKMMYRVWENMKPTEKEAILLQADDYLANIENL